jgi:hypothetical protein
MCQLIVDVLQRGNDKAHLCVLSIKKEDEKDRP